MGQEKIVLDFMQDVLNGHNGGHAAQYFTEDMAWHGGTVGTVAGRDAVARLMTAVVAAIPDLQADVQDMVIQDDKVVVRLVVTGTQRGDILGVPQRHRHVQGTVDSVEDKRARRMLSSTAESRSLASRPLGTTRAAGNGDGRHEMVLAFPMRGSQWLSARRQIEATNRRQDRLIGAVRDGRSFRCSLLPSARPPYPRSGPTSAQEGRLFSGWMSDRSPRAHHRRTRPLVDAAGAGSGLRIWHPVPQNGCYSGAKRPCAGFHTVQKPLRTRPKFQGSLGVLRGDGQEPTSFVHVTPRGVPLARGPHVLTW